MLNLQKDICSITDFKRNTAPILARVMKNKSPAVLTLNGASSVVVLDVETYQNLIEAAEYTQVLKAVEQGIKEAQKGNSIPATQVFSKMQQMLADRKGS